jgi:hypothetical protein
MMTTSCLFGTKDSSAVEAVLDRDAFPEKPVFLVFCRWTRQLMLSSYLQDPPGTCVQRDSHPDREAGVR